jgi:5'-nucleotidase
MNPGGIRADIPAGDITWGVLYSVQPFGNRLKRMNLTGEQIYSVLEQQWQEGQSSATMLEISGLSYTWDGNRPIGSRVVEVWKNGVAIDRGATYSITTNAFLAGGGDNFTAFRGGSGLVSGPIDIDALIAYIQSLPQPIHYSRIQKRTVKLHETRASHPPRFW